MIETKTSSRDQAVEWLEKAIPNFAIRVAPVYQALNWTWWMSPNPPDAAAIERALQELMTHVRKGSTSAATGGLVVELTEKCGTLEARLSMQVDAERKFIVGGAR